MYSTNSMTSAPLAFFKPGFQQHRYVARLNQLVPEFQPEIGRQAVPFNEVRQNLASSVESFDRGGRGLQGSGGCEFEPTGIAIIQSAGIVLRDLVVGNRPSAIGNVRTVFEVQRIQRNTSSTPKARRASQSHPSVLSRVGVRRGGDTPVGVHVGADRL
jgi:hypothetical protein